MAGVAAADYQGGPYWPVLWRAAGFPGTAQDEAVWARAFRTAIGRLGMATFAELSLSSAEPVQMHAGIPAYCLGEYFQLLLSRCRADPEMDAGRFLAWVTAPDQEGRRPPLDEPARQFLRTGGDYALDIVDRTLDLLGRLTEADPDFGAVGLPSSMIEAAKEELAAGHLDLSGLPGSAGRTDRRGARAGRRQAPPQIALDPHGQGVHVLLPAVGHMPAGVARWRITADGDTRTVHSRAMWVGAAGTTPQTACPLDRPVHTVLVALADHEDLVTRLAVVDPADPVMFFAEDGRQLAGSACLPRDQVWVIHPADRELEFTGHPGPVGEPAVPVGWEGWRLRLLSLDNVQAVGLHGGPPHAVEASARPRLLLDDPLPGVATPSGAPVYAVPPRLHLPQDRGASIRWYAEVRRAGGGAPLAGGAVGPGEDIDVWGGVPRPVLGPFEVTVRGPLGRGLRRTVFVAEGLIAGYYPQVRTLTRAGLAPGTARLTATTGATALPTTLRFGPGERAQVIEYQTDAGPEPLVVTPPHVAVLCAGAGVTTWTTSQVHLVAEDIPKLGHLLIRVPATSPPGQAGQAGRRGQPSRLELAVIVRGQRVQAIAATGQPCAGVAGFDLARAAGTVAAAGRAELAVELDGVLMPVGYVRPRRLVPGVELLAPGTDEPAGRETAAPPDLFSPTRQ
jgi:hypothetical protein